ncbi:MAG: PadR family transcriptional regulator [Candidatus Sulfotelmatobacter sp.]
MKAELYILGILHRGDFHPYEIKRRLTQAMIECFTDVDIGTLYYAVRQLAECGLLTAVAHQRVARGGMRTVYRITLRGRDRFRELLHAQFAAEGDPGDSLRPHALLASRRPQPGRRGSAHPNRQAECAAGGDPEIASAMGKHR